jgi:hypothetical protein
MEVKGPLNLYELLLQQPVGSAEIEKSIALVSKCSEYRFVTTIAPVVRQKGDPGKISYLTPREVAEAANLIKKETGDNRQPYRLRIFDPKKAIDEKLRTLEALIQHALFSYRSEACKHQFKTEIQI